MGDKTDKDKGLIKLFTICDKCGSMNMKIVKDVSLEKYLHEFSMFYKANSHYHVDEFNDYTRRRPHCSKCSFKLSNIKEVLNNGN